MTRILALGSRSRLLRKAHALGLELVHVQKPSLADPAAARYCSEVLLFDFQDLALATDLVTALHRHRPFDRIVSQAEIGQIPAAHLTDVLGLPGNGLSVVETLHDKWRLRQLLNARGIGPVAAEVVTAPEPVLAFLERHGDAVIKPLTGSGSLGVRMVADAAGALAAWAWAQESGLDRLLVEERLRGPEFSVESFSSEGRHEIVAITGKHTGGGVVELGHVVPAPLGEEQARSITALTEAALDAAGLTVGPAHTEVILTEQGPRIVEAHARRGGDSIPELVELVYGVDLESLAYAVATGPIPSTQASPPAGAAAIRFLVAEPGEVVEISGVEAAERIPGVVRVRLDVAVGDLVHELAWSDDRCGEVLVTAPDAAAAVALAAAVADTVVIRTRPVTSPTRRTLRAILNAADEILDPLARLRRPTPPAPPAPPADEVV
ncbi:ATP-grasp domain-containing protein [Streptacidiphilus jiangxiensis]|uniref:Biotin carboxylase n=1 Tax=Streptacidiphilus jiangxiensis TaxID=235985 RepID=A0A1H7ZMZ5_STRJI|nr:ATP-grasp domain-containing protein [Streptacidiphilus jiangxiensis]SEM58918.1 Biotin carboxylase [Streptacidiphilus jiangxiensis]